MSSRRKASNRGGLHLEFPALAFLSIMLGLMSVMALTTMSIAVKKRQETVGKTTVELVGVPNSFRPFYVRCSGDSISWQTDDGEWHQTTAFGLIAWIRVRDRVPIAPQDTKDFVQFLREKTLANAKLSFSGQQNTMIMWVEPGGIEASSLVQYLASDVLNLPLRIGKLPIETGDKIKAP